MIAATGLGISSVSINATISTRQKIAWGAWLCAGDASLTSSGKFSATMGVSPYPFAMVVAMAASAAFMTPVSSPVNTLVLGPGNYSFSDFVKLGVPFTIIVMAVCVVMIPMLFPF